MAQNTKLAGYNAGATPLTGNMEHNNECVRYTGNTSYVIDNLQCNRLYNRSYSI